MKTLKTLISITILSIFYINNNVNAEYSINNSTLSKVQENWYLLSFWYNTETECNDKVKDFNKNNFQYKRSECFENDRKYYYFRCNENQKCDLITITNNNVNIINSTTNNNLNNNTSNDTSNTSKTKNTEYSINNSTLSKIQENWYLLSFWYDTEKNCNDKIKEFNSNNFQYKRSECFENNKKYYYFRCSENQKCDLINITKNSISNTNITTNNSNINSKNNTTNNLSNNSNLQISDKLTYLIRTYNIYTNKYYLKTSNTIDYNKIITHKWEKIKWILVLSKANLPWTRAVYISEWWADWYLTYRKTNKLVWYTISDTNNSRVKIYNCLKKDDLYISSDVNCEWNKRYDNNTFYMQDDSFYNNTWKELVASVYTSLNNDITIVAHTKIDKNKISFCILWWKCSALSNKWINYYSFWSNKKVWYELFFKNLPTWNYKWYFRYIDINWELKNSNIISNNGTISTNTNQNWSAYWKLTNLWKKYIQVTYTIPQWFNPKFYFNYNWWNYQLIEEWWKTMTQNWLNTYTQNFSWLFSWIYKAYVTYGTNKLDLGSITIK